MALSSLATIYPVKSGLPAQGVSMWDHPDAAIVQAAFNLVAVKVATLVAADLVLTNKMPHTQSISLKSSGTTVFVPTFKKTPVAIFVMGKNATGSHIVSQSCRASIMLSTTCTLKTGTGSANGSGLATFIF